MGLGLPAWDGNSRVERQSDGGIVLSQARRHERFRVASEQEVLIESIFANTFGSPFLYRPQPYYKGEKVKVEKEPFDLAWVAGDLAVLFYLNRSVRPLPEQIDHNQKGAHGYVRLWASGDPRFVLPGINRFGRECRLPFSAINYLVTVLIVSCECGAYIRRSNQYGKWGLQLVLPESLMRVISKRNATIVDLFGIVALHMKVSLPSISNAGRADHARLMLEAHDYFVASQNVAARELANLLAMRPKDLPPLVQPPPTEKIVESIFNSLLQLKLPVPGLGATQKQLVPDELPLLFSDLNLSEYMILSGGVTVLLQISDAPEFRYSQQIEISLSNRRFILASLALQSSNFKERSEMVFNSSLGPNGKAQALVLIYERLFFDPATWAPWMILCPEETEPSKTKLMIDTLIECSSALKS